MAGDTRSWTTSSSHGPIHSSLTFTVDSGTLYSFDTTSECRLRPGDTLHGTYRITTELAMGGRWVEFLHLRHRLQLDDDYALEDGRRVYTASFVLVVPAGIDRTNDRAQDECKPLPPSFHIQRSTFRTWSPTIPPNVFISYSLRASVAHAMKSAEIVYPVTCLPYIEAQPPIETNCFPDDYVLSASQTAWRWLLGQTLGRITFEAREPPPLLYNSSEHLSTTHFSTRTYYSGTKLTGNPSRAFVQESSRTQLHMDTIQLDVHSFSSLQWSPRDVRRGSSMVGAAAATTDKEESPPWYAAVHVPIKPPLKLLPSFCSDYVASSYAIIAKVSISGVHAKPSYLMFPLQVAYPSSAQKDSGHQAADSRGLAPPVFSSSPEDNVCCTAVDADVQCENPRIVPPYVDVSLSAARSPRRGP
ncbi:uncharacterized protein F5Z01DRAFT_679218 [Emericellopsis atlantica]|uniref:Arrestin-like N-terminal domain-containing protein n=1 Tax=Emericellopsis atlantica TaxID=2614577 RepID=A0A9P8CWW4_9HYPO|nr:uncharacterized protein F5Z01DRAFT_679218 [Emericellopsis atlantica]KAG9258751.1 hypothetical protein F5Z01DRAFT_679218 [Emericellopsis atlantica]